MSRLAASGVAAAALAIIGTNAQTYSNTYGVYTVTQDTGADVPLASKHFEWPHLPYKADSGETARGIQIGYNICNATTLGDNSMCQTAHINSIQDFCIWGSDKPNAVVADIEAGMVAYCTLDTHGTRIIKPGTFQGVQWITTPDYVEVVGQLDQTKINLKDGDTGGEEDPHGADYRGNPLGALVYSTAFKSSGSSNVTQVIEWDYFVGSNVFCFKACDPAGNNAARLCEHRYDEIGCAYNSPASYDKINGTFTECDGDNQTPVGEYVSNGKTVTWTQPYDVEFTVPYTAAIPATSNCKSYTSSNLFTVGASSAASKSSSSGKSKSTSAGASADASGSSGSGSGSGSSSGAVVYGASGFVAALSLAVGVLTLIA